VASAALPASPKVSDAEDDDAPAGETSTARDVTGDLGPMQDHIAKLLAGMQQEIALVEQSADPHSGAGQ
jgi:hypothetical protein